MANIKGVPWATPAKYTFATMPAVATHKGQIIFVTDGRKGAEGAGAGKGNMAFSDGIIWAALDTGVAITS